MFDAHCHIGFAQNAHELGCALAQRGVRCFSNTVCADDFLHDAEVFADCSNIVVGLGMHPWWVLDGSIDDAAIAQFETHAATTRFIGEIGLDFGRKYREAAPSCQRRMCDAFGRALAACAQGERKLLSIHAVRAVTQTLDALEAYECTRTHSCILHWFSGTDAELGRARALGCFFSVGSHMLATKRGRAYARAIPLDHLLLETDAPEYAAGCVSADTLYEQLTDTIATLAELRRMNAAELARIVDENAAYSRIYVQ